MARRISGIICLFGLLLGVAIRAADVPGPALPLFDAYLAEAARSVTAYRTEIRLGADPKDLGHGRQAGQSAYLGSFTYRPVTYAELDREERARLVHDPQFHAFLAKLSRPGTGTRAAPTTRYSTATTFRCTIAPEEMLRTEPFVIVLPP